MTTPHPDVTRLSLADLRAHRDRLRRREAQVSYWRRLVHARIDLIGMLGTRVVVAPLDQVVSALGDAPTPCRGRFTPVEVLPPLPDVADLGAVWEVPVDADQSRDLLARLGVVGELLSRDRAALHASIDEATDELVRRYHDDPETVLAAR